MKTLHIGITGGIGSGKTTIAKLFAELGTPIYYADDRAKELMTTDKTIIAALKTEFGEDVYLPTGALNRPFLSNIVFKNPEKLAILNNIMHPIVIKDSENWQKAHATHAYTLKEAALLIESNSYQLLDKLIVVVAPLPLRITRVMARDKCSEEAVLARINAQMSDTDRLKHADFVVHNEADNSENPLSAQVLKLHHLFLKMSGV
jgi:dephospho-CoA kinase